MKSNISAENKSFNLSNVVRGDMKNKLSPAIASCHHKKSRSKARDSVARVIMLTRRNRPIRRSSHLAAEARKEAHEALLSVLRIGFALLRDAVIILLWLVLSYACSLAIVFFKSHGLDPNAERSFLFIAHWGIFLRAAGYVLRDLVGLFGEIRKCWRELL